MVVVSTRGRVEGAVGCDRVIGRVQGGADLVGGRAVGALVEVEGDGAAAGADQAGEGGGVGDACAEVTVAAETWVARPGVFFSTVVFSLVSRQAPLAALLLASPE